MRRVIAVGLMIGMVALIGACSGSKKSATPKFTVVLDDGGLKLPSGKTKAGRYLISFSDRRSHKKAGEIARLQFRASGPTFVLLEVPAGAEKVGTLFQNEVASVAVNGVPQNVLVKNPLDVVATKEFPTPVT
ncbi:MAG TPA: hypothetical protein VGP92_12775 [Acidimicrobiia bacterium]|nr:hypothetical protein [Acidimicrobiia bacterium]